jgi:hypothetical protein
MPHARPPSSFAYYFYGCQIKSILDPSFRYTNSGETDLRKTFSRVRRELRNQHQQQAVARAESIRTILPF